MVDYKDFTTSVVHHASGTHLIEVPQDIAKQFIEHGQKRVICILDRVHIFHVALTPDGRGSYLIVLGKSKMKKANLRSGDLIHVQLNKDDSKIQFESSQVLEEVLEEDEIARQIFEELTPGRKRTIIHLINQAKREPTQIRRALKIVENFKKGVRRPGDFLK